MNEQNGEANSQWDSILNGTSTTINSMEPAPSATESPVTQAAVSDAEDEMPEVAFAPDTGQRRGFFEAIKHAENPRLHLAALLKEYEAEAQLKMGTADRLAEMKITHLQERIEYLQQQWQEIAEKIKVAEQYKESEDEVLHGLLQERERQEQALTVLQEKIAAVRIKLGEAKAGILNKSLDEAEMQVKTALNIQRTIYEETRQLNLKKFTDEKDHLAQLSEGYKVLYASYEKRYQKLEQHLVVLDVDGISPLTTKVLNTVGSVSFGVAGFFFSTFAGNAGFGNFDLCYFILNAFMDTANEPISGWAKLAILIGLLVLVTLVGIGCNYLLNRLKNNSEEEIISEVGLGASFSKKLKQLEYHATVKSNNWYGFWLQLVPGILIAGLIVLGVARSATRNNMGALNASTEGLIIGTGIAMAFAGLVYLYIIKIVEPRLVKRYNAAASERVNWLKGNWELVAVILLFLFFVMGITLVPYDASGSNTPVIPVDKSTRFAILVFASICLVGGICFAYGVRSRGLIETSRYMERVMRRIKSTIAYCSCAEAPELNNKVAEEHGNIIQHVLKQLSYKAVTDKERSFDAMWRQKAKRKGFWDYILKTPKNEELHFEQALTGTLALPWEVQYYPHIVDELKALDFSCNIQIGKTTMARNAVNEHRATKASLVSQLTSELRQIFDEIQAQKAKKERVLQLNSYKKQQVMNTYNLVTVDVMDGFHLGLWYRENGMGPSPLFFELSTPGTGPITSSFITAQ